MTIRVLNDHYVLQTDNAGQFRALFPDLKEAVVQGRQFVAVPHTLEVARVLNNIGVKVQSPIRRGTAGADGSHRGGIKSIPVSSSLCTAEHTATVLPGLVKQTPPCGLLTSSSKRATFIGS